VEVESPDEVVAATRRLSAEGLPTEVEEGVTCCHALQDKVWVSGADARWEIYTVLADAPGATGACACVADTAAGTEVCCS